MFSENDLLFPLTDQRFELLGKGGFKRKICVAAQCGSQLEADRLFIQKVLQAAKIDSEQDIFEVLFAPQTSAAIAPFLRKKQPEFVLVFGLDPKALQLSITPALYTPFSFYDTSWLWADTPEKLDPDKVLKSRLWSALQTLFLK